MPLEWHEHFRQIKTVADPFPATATIPRVGQFRHIIGPFCRRLLAPTAIAAGLWMAAPAEAQETAPDPKDYVIFLGMDLFADRIDEQERLPVVGGSGGTVVVLGENGTSAIPRSDAVLTATLEPKVSRGAVTLEAFRGHPVYSPRANPATHELSQMMALQGVDAIRRDAADRAAYDARMAVARAGAEAAAVPQGNPGARAAAEARFDEAAAASQAAMSEVGEAAASTVLTDNLPVGIDESERYDGFEVTFRVSAQEPHANAYGVLQLTISEPAHPELGTQHAFQVFRLPAIGPKPRKVSVSRFKLPFGFSVDAYEVHVYVDDRELATNTSRNRVDVTKAEAQQFLILQHMQRNKGASQEPQVAKELRPVWPRPGLAEEWENITVTLRITPEGKVEETDVAGGIASPLTEELSMAVREVPFLPALVVGVPTVSTRTFALGELFRKPKQQL